MPLNYAEYPPNWKEIRERILTRAGNRCENENCHLLNHSIICKVDRRQPSPQQWDMYNSMLGNHYSKQQAMKRMGFTEIVLTIAHLDHDKLNHDVKDDRLKALCQACHLKYDLPRHIENRKYGRNFRKNQQQLF